MKSCGHFPCHDWCRACIGGAGRSDAYRRQQEDQNATPVSRLREEQASSGNGISQKYPMLLVIWSMLVQCKGAEDQATIRETVESLNRLGHPEL